MEFGPEKVPDTKYSGFLFSRRVFLGSLHTSLSCGYRRVVEEGLERKGAVPSRPRLGSETGTQQMGIPPSPFNSWPIPYNRSPLLKRLLLCSSNRGQTGPSLQSG